MQEHMLLHTRQSSTQHTYITNKFCTKLDLFTRLYRDARSTKHKILYTEMYEVVTTQPPVINEYRGSYSVVKRQGPEVNHAPSI